MMNRLNIKSIFAAVAIASVTFTSCDGSKGYISCRRMASQNEIEKYEASYKNMK